MSLSVDYIARETASNLWRNRLITLAAVVTVAVSLSLVGAAMLLRQGVANATVQWQHGVNVIVWFDPAANGAPQPEQHAIAHELLALPYVRSCIYRSQTYDFAEAHRILAPDEAQALTVGTTPPSERCVLDNPDEAEAIWQQFRHQPGVQSVFYPGQAIRNMESVTHVLQWVFLVVAVVLLVSASVLIVNTIRLAIFARRREVAVMKLVGATNWFIRVPFMFEGLLQGLLGALLAVAVVLLLHWRLDALASANQQSVWNQMRMSGPEVVLTAIAVLLVGVLVGTVGSALAIRRFLAAERIA